MILPLHIAIALGSMVSVGFLYIGPSKLKLRATYALVALTIATGFYLVATKPAHITQVCITGLLYLAGMAFVIISARRKMLARERMPL